MKSKGDDLDGQLDAALLKYAEVEPRAGLEERVLANLRAQPRVWAYRWWRWPAVAAAAAVTLVGVISLISRSAISKSLISRSAVSKLQHRPSLAAHPPGGAAPQTVPDAARATTKPVSAGKQAMRSARHAAARASLTRLDQFPSPQPLSEQETMLANYVARYPENAASIAQARAEELQHDLAEEAAATNFDQ
jgi:hypothetical protein